MARVKTQAARAKPDGVLDTVKTVLYAGLIAIGIRTIAFEPFNIPSGSMMPTLLVGDYLFVSKFSYGYSHFSLPLAPNLFHGRIFGSLPTRGDVAVFRNPNKTSEDYIKRVIGLPGDRVQVRRGQLFVNGVQCPTQSGGNYTDDDARPPIIVSLYRETLPNGVVHDILKRSEDGYPNNTPEFRVPEDHVFVMGDNRDNSADSRFMDGTGVGFVPTENLIGRAEVLFFSIDAQRPWYEVWEWPFEIRWTRLLKLVK